MNDKLRVPKCPNPDCHKGVIHYGSDADGWEHFQCETCHGTGEMGTMTEGGIWISRGEAETVINGIEAADMHGTDTDEGRLYDRLRAELEGNRE
jgi:hypothetical protein